MTTIELDNLAGEVQQRIAARSGAELIQLCRNGQPIALLQFLGPAPPNPTGPRPVGLAQGTFVVPPEFFDPLPADLIASFNGEGS